MFWQKNELESYWVTTACYKFDNMPNNEQSNCDTCQIFESHPNGTCPSLSVCASAEPIHTLPRPLPTAIPRVATSNKAAHQMLCLRTTLENQRGSCRAWSIKWCSIAFWRNVLVDHKIIIHRKCLNALFDSCQICIVRRTIIIIIESFVLPSVYRQLVLLIYTTILLIAGTFLRSCEPKQNRNNLRKKRWGKKKIVLSIYRLQCTSTHNAGSDDVGADGSCDNVAADGFGVGGEADVAVDGFGVGCEVRLCVGGEARLYRCYCQVLASQGLSLKCWWE
jgi:hypothetical protein